MSKWELFAKKNIVGKRDVFPIPFPKAMFSRVIYPLQNNAKFERPWKKNLLKSLWAQEKLLVTSIFTFSHIVFCAIKERKPKFNLLSANSFILNQSKTLLFNKGLMCSFDWFYSILTHTFSNRLHCIWGPPLFVSRNTKHFWSGDSIGNFDDLSGVEIDAKNIRYDCINLLHLEITRNNTVHVVMGQSK